jgi:hypothetical protein
MRRKRGDLRLDLLAARAGFFAVLDRGTGFFLLEETDFVEVVVLVRPFGAEASGITWS